MNETKFEHEAEIGHNVAIHYLGGVYYKRVTAVQPIPWFQFLDIGAIALQVSSGSTQALNLAQYDGEWAQFRWYPLDYVQVRMWLPQSQGMWTMRNFQGVLDNQIVYRDPCLHLTEFHIWQDNVPWFTALNFPDYAASGCRLMAGGFRYCGVDVAEYDKKNGTTILKDILSGKEKCKHIWASGVASVAS